MYVQAILESMLALSLVFSKAATVSIRALSVNTVDYEDIKEWEFDLKQ